MIKHRKEAPTISVMGKYKFKPQYEQHYAPTKMAKIKKADYCKHWE